MTDSAIAEGQVKLRDGKKWKSRWLVLRKPSPVADCLLLLVFKDKSEKSKGQKERSSVTLEDICGLDPGLSLEGVNHILAIICLGQTVLLAFENKDTMSAWDMRTRYSLGEVHRFHVTVLPGTKLESGPATLHFCNNIFVLVRDVPPTIIGQWKLSDMRRYGAIPNGFVFEGGSRCGLWAGVFCLSCAEGERISFLFDCIVRGISPTKGPFGLRPVLPDPSMSSAYLEEKISHEALELEKRLSLLSQSSRQSSGGDDRSLSSSTESSDTSQSDSASMGSRLTLWPEQLTVSGLQEGHSLGPAARGLGPAEEKIYAEVTRGSKPPPKPPRSRKLQEVGRQSSSDSGIATASHSSYSGSFSSYTGSLDVCQSDEFGSLLSLPSHLPAERTLCTCEAPATPGSEYQVPSSIQHHYDTPRSVIQAAAMKEAQPVTSPPSVFKDQAPAPQETADSQLLGIERGFPSVLEGARDPTGELYAGFVPGWKPQGQALDATGSEVSSLTGTPMPGVGSTDPCEIYSPYPGVGRALFTACLTCGGLKGPPAWLPGTASIPVVPDKKPNKKEEKLKMVAGQMYEFMEAFPMDKQSELEKGSGYEYMASCGQHKLLLEGEGAPGSSKVHRAQGAYLDIVGLKHKKEKGFPEDESSGGFDTKKLSGGAFAYPLELISGSDRSRPAEGATYVNIPVSPTSKKQLHYMELDLQESSPAIRGASSSKYAQIDITATETAHKVGTQHAQNREERLQELEQKRKGAAPQ
ncbi:protein Dok-7 isoform X2 [Scyliorhinus torazame]|uniref:protein Dok-7 isoform X2 n=1 Tax=Scyliorhinus torazame TaxID=75743 RepID=UPI003B5B925E